MSSDILIQRSVFSEKDFKEKHSIPEEQDHAIFPQIKDKTKRYLSSTAKHPRKTAKSFMYSVLPILTWIPKYPVKEWLVSDLISGLTVGVMQIPQGMSYALLAGQHPIFGLYTAFFPVLLFTLLATSRHVSMGAFAITSLMLGSAVSGLVPDPVFNSTTTGALEQVAWDEVYAERIQISVATNFIVGIFLLCLSVFNLGSIVIYLSDPMISGFTCGAAVHVFVSQLKGLFGVKIGSYSGPLNAIYAIRDIILALTSLDESGRRKTAATVVISVICVTFLLAVKEINERFKKKLPLGIPIPGEIIVVIVGTGISYGADLAGLYDVSIVGEIPSGLPVPAPPPIEKLPSVVGFAIPIAIVGYSVAVSIAKIFGNNFGYSIRPNQELVAYGSCNLLASFFFCIPSFPSMSRSCVQVDSGGKTQLVGWISASLILLVLLVVGPLFRTIPRACLAAIIAVAIKGMLKKVKDFKPYWRTSKLDAAVWMVSCLCTIFLDVVFGLVAGVGFSLLCVVFRTQFVKSETLCQIKQTEIYRKCMNNSLHYVRSDFVVMAFNGPLHYVNKDRFRNAIVKLSGIDPALEVAKQKKDKKNLEKIKKRAAKEERENNTKDAATVISVQNISFSDVDSPNHINMGSSSPNIKCIILHCTHVSFIDSVGVKYLTKILQEYKNIGIKFLLAEVSENVQHTLQLGNFHDKFDEDVIFLTTHDAVTWWRNHENFEGESEITTF